MSFRIDESLFGQFIYQGDADQQLSVLVDTVGSDCSDSSVQIETETRSFTVERRSKLAVPDVDEGLGISINIRQFQLEGSDTDYEAFVDAMTHIYEATDPLYGYGIRQGTLELSDTLNSPTTREAIAESRIVVPSWLMVFTPEMVEEYDREWLLDLPADRFTELSDGGLLIVSTERLVSEPEETGKFEDDMAAMDEAFGIDPVETGNKSPI